MAARLTPSLCLAANLEFEEPSYWHFDTAQFYDGENDGGLVGGIRGLLSHTSD